MIIDCITFNGEKELFEIRYNILKDFVDEFRVIEFDQTFSGKRKDPTFPPEWTTKLDKIKHYFVLENTWNKYEDLAIESPNTEYGKGAKHWIREFCMKESIKDCLTDLQDDDIIFIGDCDEIYGPQPELDKTLRGHFKIKLKVYSYWLNNKSNEEFWGTLVARYGEIKNNCLNHLRNTTSKTEFEYGWHFTSMGGYEKVKEKLTDSYTTESYATSQVLGSLENNIKESKDFLGRDFKYRLDEENWPEYLKNNKEKYKHLCK